MAGKLGELLDFAKREVHNLETVMRENRFRYSLQRRFITKLYLILREEEAKFERMVEMHENEAKAAEDQARRLDEEADRLERNML